VGQPHLWPGFIANKDISQLIITADAEYEQLGMMKRQQTFICKEGVDTKRLLQLTRKELYNDAKRWGANGLIDESWTCEVYRLREGVYDARVSRSVLYLLALH
jgi:hypothetical protein